MAITTDSARELGSGLGQETSNLHTGECAAHDLKALMGDVIRQISDADRRNSELLRQMQERLASMGVEARSARDRVPNEYLPGFDRIEDGMALLAQRIAQSFAERKSATPDLPTPGPTEPPASIPAATPVQPAEYAPLPSTGASFGTFQFSPPPSATQPSAPFTHALRSSTTGHPAHRASKYGANVDTFDVVESVAGNPAEPWAPDHVDALTRLYDGGEPMFTGPTEPHQSSAAPAAPLHAPTLSVMTAESPISSGVDRNWLEERLADVSSRIEQSLTAPRPDAAFASIERRFDDLENRLSVAMSGVATKGDVHAIAAIERHLQDLTTHVDHALAELTRLDGIEGHMATLLDQVSNDHLSHLFERAIVAHVEPRRADRSEPDYHAVALAAAEATAFRMASTPRDTSRHDARFERVDDVHSLLTGFIDERRQGDDYTAQVLDSLQQGMLRILDRVETMEAERHPAPAYVQDAHVQAAPVAASHMDRIVPAHDTFNPALHAYPADHYGDHAPLAAEPAMTGDVIKDRRADLQASAQRAALAQREKLKTQAAPAKDASSGSNARMASPKKSAPSKADQQGSRRLMVSSLILATVLAGGAGLIVMNRGDSDVLASPIQASPVAAAPAKDKTAAMAPALAPPAGPAKAPLKADASTPVTVTDDIQRLGEVRETDRAPDLPEPKFRSRRMSDSPAPIGILVQEASSQSSQPPTEPAIKIAASPADMPGEGAPGVASGQPRNALDLPPATVGPLSLRMAAAAGDGSAEFEVGTRLAEGKGTDQNFKEAMRWYQRAATQGFAQAQYRLGSLFERGLGVPSDLARAKSWYQRAAEQGNVKAMHNLAVLAAGRVSASPDYETAAQWFTKAAAYGLQDSQFNLAVLTESGLGLQRDPIQAAQWFILASKAGDKESIRRRDALKKQMEPADYAAAEQQAKVWQAQPQDKLANDARFAGELWKARQSAANPDNG
jgi:localization factor PodJL